MAWSKPVSGNHNDLFQIENQVKTMIDQLKESSISVEGLFINADAGFDAKILRKTFDREGVILNASIVKSTFLSFKWNIFLNYISNNFTQKRQI